MSASREVILAALAAFVRQRPGLEYGNYGDPKSYRAEMRQITNDRHDAEELLRVVGWSSITAEQLVAGFRAFSGRLTWTPNEQGGGSLSYVTGQYFPTEYRKAVCAVLASALWYHWRNADAPNADHIRQAARRNLSRRIVRGYFN